jgi:MoxR-like ATPase
MEISEKVTEFQKKTESLILEIKKCIVGNDDTIKKVVIALLSSGHVLLEGVPGVGKTLLVRTLASALNLGFSRIQFTPDLMPADIIGTNIIAETETGSKYFKFEKGPVFTNILLADEINRATPKTQSALLEAMQEHRVTVLGHSYTLDEPFFVLATQNPLEMEGTYPLPEAQLDRFFFKIKIMAPSASQLKEVLDRTTTEKQYEASNVLSGDDLLKMRELVLTVPVADHVADFVVNLVLSTHPDLPEACEIAKKYIRYGASPRAAQSIILAAKVTALLDNRYNVSIDDIVDNAKEALRHRIILNFEGESEGISTDEIIDNAITELKEKTKG